MPEIDWIIHIVANGMRCEDCGKIENPFPQYISMPILTEWSGMDTRIFSW